MLKHAYHQLISTSNFLAPSSEESSDDWEKDFDLDMTEDEIQKALEETENVDVDVSVFLLSYN